MTRELYINGLPVDLDPSFVIAITAQNWNPIEQETSVTFTNKIKIGRTPANRALFQYIDDIKAVSNIYKSRLPARYVQNGIEVIPNGYVIIYGSADTYFDCAIFAGIIDIYSKLSDKWLTDLDYTDVNSSWSDADQDSKIGTANPFNYGGTGNGTSVGKVFAAFIGTQPASGSGNLNLSGGNMQISPCLVFFGYQGMLMKIIEQAGYGWDVGLLDDGAHATSDGRFKNLAICQGQPKGSLRDYSARFRKSITFSASVKGADFVSVNLGLNGTATIPFTTMVECPFWNVAVANKYVVAETRTALAYFSTNFYFFCQVKVDFGTADVRILLNGAVMGGGLASASLGIGTTTNIGLYGLDQQLKNGDVVEVQVKQTSVNPCTITIRDGAAFYNQNAYSAVGTYCLFNEFLPPDLTQLDLFKDFLIRFGQIPKEASGKMYFKSVQEILDSITNSFVPQTYIDWTNKRDPAHLDTIENELSNLAQVNTYKYQVETTDTPDSYLSGSFTIDDTRLPALKETTSFFKLLRDKMYENVIFSSFFEGLTATLGSFTTLTDIGTRLFTISQNTANEGPIKVGTAAARTTFVKASETRGGESAGQGISYQNSLNARYTHALSGGGLDKTTGFLNQLKNAKWVTRYYNLNDVDIYSLDPHKLIFDDGAYFMFPKVFNFVPGKSTKVRMLKI